MPLPPPNLQIFPFQNSPINVLVKAAEISDQEFKNCNCYFTARASFHQPEPPLGARRAPAARTHLITKRINVLLSATKRAEDNVPIKESEGSSRYRRVDQAAPMRVTLSARTPEKWHVKAPGLETIKQF